MKFQKKFQKKFQMKSPQSELPTDLIISRVKHSLRYEGDGIKCKAVFGSAS